MKKLIAASLLALCLCSRASAGDVPFPGKQDPPPPPCTENCTTTSIAPNEETTTLEDLTEVIIWVIVIFRP